MGAKYINVYDYLTTTLSGLIKETAKAANLTVIDAIVAGYDAEGDYQAEAKVPADQFVKAESSSSATNSETITIAAPVSPAGKATTKSETDGSTTTVNDTVVTFPASSIVKSDDSDTAVSLNIATKSLISDGEGDTKTASTGAGLAVYQISGSNGAPAAALEFKLDGAKLDENLSSDNSDNAPIGHTYIAKNLGESFDTTKGETATLSIGYVPGSGTVEAEDDKQKPELLKYDANTGYLEYRVYHFSTYVIFANKYAATDSNEGLYETFKEALDNASDGAIINLWKDEDDATGGKYLSITKSLTIDLGGNKFNLGTGGFMMMGDNVTFKNGTMISEIESDTAKYTIACFSNVTFQNIVFNHEKKVAVCLIAGSADSLSIIDSKFNCKTSDAIVYVQGDSYDEEAIDVVIKNSEIVNSGEGPAITSFRGNFTIENSTIQGTKVGAELGSGAYDVKNSTINGSEVALSVFNIGESNEMKAVPTTVNLSNVKFVVGDVGSVLAATFNDEKGLTSAINVEGSITDDSSITVTKDLSNAEVLITKGDTIYVAGSESFLKASQMGGNVTLLSDITIGE